MQKLLLVILFFCAAAKSGAGIPHRQDSLTHALSTVQISAFGKRSIVGKNMQDSLGVIAPPNVSLSRLLAGSGKLYLREYSPGGIGSISIRGGNAAQTAVLWDGLNIQNSMLGQTDPSLVASELFSDIIIEPQSSSTGWGSGPVAGAVHLLMNDTINALRLGANYNSFGALRHSIKGNYRKGAFRHSLGLVHENSRNRFTYENDSGIVMKAKHAAHQGLHANYNADLALAGHKLYLRTWAARVFREIPPTLDMQSSEAEQQDEFIRMQLGIKKYYHKFGYDFRVAGFYEGLQYRDLPAGISSNGISRVVHADAEVNYRLAENLLALSGAGYQHISASIGDYGHTPIRDRLQYYAQLRWEKEQQFLVQPSYRAEWLNENKLIHIPQLDVHLRLYRGWSVRASAGKTFRYPSFNDLFWIQGGNPSLQPEDGRQAEGTLNYVRSFRHFSIEASYSVFYRRVKNWIQWSPLGILWYAGNHSLVNLRGSEWRSNLHYRKNRYYIGLECNVNYTLAENPEISEQLDRYTQLIYVPMYQGMAALTIGYERFYLFWQQQYLGHRYTSTDNYGYLPPVTISHAGISYQHGGLFRASLRSNNLFNQNYQTISRRPMPLRWLELNLQFQINQKA
jgi:vitamin B12 transporter